MFISIGNVGHCVFIYILLGRYDFFFLFDLHDTTMLERLDFELERLGFELGSSVECINPTLHQCDKATMMMMYFLFICSFFSFFLYSVTGIIATELVNHLYFSGNH